MYKDNAAIFFYFKRDGKQVYKHKTKEMYIRYAGSGNGWTVGSNILGGYYFRKTLKIMRFLSSLFFLQYNFIRTENKADDDEPWITRNFGTLDIDCA